MHGSKTYIINTNFIIDAINRDYLLNRLYLGVEVDGAVGVYSVFLFYNVVQLFRFATHLRARFLN